MSREKKAEILYPTLAYSAADLDILATADVDGDGRGDIIFRNRVTNQITIWFLSMTSVVGVATPRVVGPDYVLETVGDFNRDGNADLVWRHSTTGQMSLWLMADNGSILGESWPGVVGQEWRIQGTGDFNGDGHTDILWRSTPATGNILAIWYFSDTQHTHDGYPGLPGPYPGAEWQIKGIGKFDGNSRSDILWLASNGVVAIWFDGQNVSPTPAFPMQVSGWDIQGVANFDGDGRSDILWRATSGPETGQLAIWFMNGGTIVSQAWPPRSPGPEWEVVSTLKTKRP